MAGNSTRIRPDKGNNPVTVMSQGFDGNLAYNYGGPQCNASDVDEITYGDHGDHGPDCNCVICELH
jgi:hypothetical protein